MRLFISYIIDLQINKRSIDVNKGNRCLLTAKWNSKHEELEEFEHTLEIDGINVDFVKIFIDLEENERGTFNHTDRCNSHSLYQLDCVCNHLRRDLGKLLCCGCVTSRILYTISQAGLTFLHLQTTEVVKLAKIIKK